MKIRILVPCRRRELTNVLYKQTACHCKMSHALLLNIYKNIARLFALFTYVRVRSRRSLFTAPRRSVPPSGVCAGYDTFSARYVSYMFQICSNVQVIYSPDYETIPNFWPLLFTPPRIIMQLSDEKSGGTQAPGFVKISTLR